MKKRLAAAASTGRSPGRSPRRPVLVAVLMGSLACVDVQPGGLDHAAPLDRATAQPQVDAEFVRRRPFDSGLLTMLQRADVVVEGTLVAGSISLDYLGATLQVAEAFKGTVEGPIQVKLGPIRVEQGHSLFAFLKFGDGRSTHTLLRAIYFRLEDASTMRVAIRSAVAAGLAESKLDIGRSAAARRWMLEHLTRRATRALVLSDIFSGMPSKREAVFNPPLRHEELKPLESGLVHAASLDDSLLKLLWLFDGIPSAALDGVVVAAIDRAVQARCVSLWMIEAHRLVVARRLAAGEPSVDLSPGLQTQQDFGRAWEEWTVRTRTGRPVDVVWGPGYDGTEGSVLLVDNQLGSAKEILAASRKCHEL